MPFNPGASWFIPFHEHDPSTNDRCIYFTQNETRCRWPCQTRDNDRAIELFGTISGLPAEAVGIELIKDYILCNCCRSGRAQHRDRIEDVGLWTPLAERWLGEIRRHATEQSSRTVSVSPLEESAILPDAVATPATPTPSRATTAYITPTASSPYFRPSTPTSSSINTTPPTSVGSSSVYQNTSPKTLDISAEIAPLPSGGQPHYDLRPCDTHISTNAISVQPTTISQLLPSEFRAHIAEPGPTDSVSSKIRDVLVKRDFETGSLYIFDRDSSPGYVKIGWTARSVERRLESWSECEYIPNLLFRVDHVPHAQRVETLTHYELIKEWRRERQCQAKHCGKSHQEWFETSKERAKEVLGDWAKFMKIAEPYERGVLKAEWKNFVRRTVESGETVTAKKLLEHYELSLAEDTTLVEVCVDPERALNIEEQEDDPWDTPKREKLEGLKKTSAHLDSLRIEQSASTKEKLVFESEAASEPISLEGISAPGPKKQPKSDPLIKFEPTLETGTLPRTNFTVTTETSFKSEPSRKTSVPFVSDSLFGTEPILKVKTLHEDISANKAPADTELSLEQIPLPPSSLLHPTDSQDTSSIQVTEPGASPEIEKPSVTNKITKSNSSLTVTPLSEYNPLNSSATPSPKTKANPTSDLPVPPAMEIPGGQEKAITLPSITQSRHNAEEGEQAKPESELVKCDSQVPENEIKAEDEDEGPVTESKSETGEAEWDEGETLVEVPAPGSLEKAALEIVSTLCNEISTGKTDGFPKDLDELKVLESEMLPAVEVVAQV